MGRSIFLVGCFGFLFNLAIGQNSELIISLKAFCPTPLNQKKARSCQSFAVANAINIRENVKKNAREKKQKNKGEFRGKLIFRYLIENRNKAYDVGFSVEKALAIAKEIEGLESVFKIPFNNEISDDFEIIKRILKEQFPVIIQIKLWKCFSELNTQNHTWKLTGLGQYRGVHSLVIIGFDEANQTFEVLNSWGKKWGNGGFAYIEYEAMREILLSAYIITKERKTDLSKITTINELIESQLLSPSDGI